MKTPRMTMAAALAATAWSAPYMTEPALCPTRPELVFVSGGDIWLAPAKGGEAHLLVSHPATESRPLYSPDGKRLAFVSTRTGNGDIYVLTLATGDLKRLTWDDGLDQLDNWSRDGEWIYFSSAARDVGRKNDIFRVRPTGGTPLPVSADRFLNEFQAAPAPDGVTLAFAARGNGDSQWWRNGHSHLDESEIWLRKDDQSYTKLVDRQGRNAWPMWSADGREVYFMSDRGGTQNVWKSAAAGGAPKPVTKFTSGRVLWPSISHDGRSIVFEHDFRIWQLDTKSGEAFPVPLTTVGSASGPAVTRLPVGQFTDLAVSPDDRKIAVIGHGEVFAAGAREGGEAVRVTTTPGPESQVAWSPDSTRLVFVSQRDAVNQVMLYDFRQKKEIQLTTGAGPAQAPQFSPDGKSIAYLLARRQLRVIDVESKQDRVLAEGALGGSFAGAAGVAWSPDSKWIAYAAYGAGALRHVHVIPAAGGEPRQISFLANTSASGLVWSPDGKFILYSTGQRTESREIARIDLVPPEPKFSEEQFDDLFKNGAAGATKKAATPKVEIVFDDIRRRASMLPIGLDAGAPKISPDGTQLLFAATVGGQTNLYLYPLEDGGRRRGGGGGQRVARQLTSTPGPKSDAHFSADGKTIYYLEAGRPQAMALDTRTARAINVSAEMDVDFRQEKLAVFEQAWAGQRDGFYDPGMHGVDWNAVRERYRPLVEAATTPDELRALLRLMVGELNASHSGVSAPNAPVTEGPGSGPRGVIGQLGLSFDRAKYESSGTLAVTHVLPHSPGALAGLKPGDEIRAVDGAAAGAGVNLDSLLEHKTGKRVTLDVSGRAVMVRPVASLADLSYRQWVEDNRAYVTRASQGHLGYVHMRDMSAEALTQLYLDLDAENRSRAGVVIDLRNNNGGFVNAYALDVLARKPYMTMISRGAPAGPARTVLGQRSLEKPTVLVVNQHSLSDAEDFTEGYRALGLGKVVGEPTAGWIIYTGSLTLVDGSLMRMPGTLVTGADGRKMEGVPRPVDVAVTRPVGETYTGRDSQLDAAVAQLLAPAGK